MRFSNLLPIAITMAVASVPGTIAAAIAVGETLEQLADTCSHVAILKNTNIVTGSENGFGVAEICGVPGEEFRGHLPQSFRFRARVRDPGTLRTHFQPGDTFLVFAREAGQGDVRAVETFNLANPENRPVALRSDFTVVSDVQAISDIVEERIRTHPAHLLGWTEKSRAEWIPVPEDSPAWQVLRSHSACYLQMPNDLQYIARRELRKRRMEQLLWDYTHSWDKIAMLVGTLCGAALFVLAVLSRRSHRRN